MKSSIAVFFLAFSTFATYAQTCPTSCPTSDEVALQAQIDALAAAGGGEIVLEPRVYQTCRPIILASNVHLRGSGRGATIIRGSAVIENLIADGSYVLASISAVGATNVSVSNLTFPAAGAPMAFPFCRMAEVEARPISPVRRSPTRGSAAWRCSARPGTITT